MKLCVLLPELCSLYTGEKPMLWIRIGFNADPYPAFYLNADTDPGIQTNADPGQTLKSKKFEFIRD